MQKRTFVCFTLLSLLTILLTFVFTGGVASARSLTPAAPLATGGCNEQSGPYGTWVFLEVGVCISDRGTGNEAFPDVYVNQLDTSAGISCGLYIELWEGNFKWSQLGPVSCNIGHYDGDPYFPVGGCHALHTSAWILYGPQGNLFYRIGDSPTYTYCGLN
ncbi:MAG TPA: hypothetical protein VFV38_30895 [Ktedonobacteraceae bacterium]|nr:hypothetical protein [Ktedonobacteraceae bacterium]